MATSRVLQSFFKQMSRPTGVVGSSTRRQLSAAAASAANKAHSLPDLAYDYSALAPVVSGKIMELHHSKHHQTYVNNLNIALEQYAEAEAKNDVAAMINLQPAIRFNGGGHVNHSIFWTNLCPGGSEVPSDLLAEIDATFGSLDKFRSTFNARSAAVQGSGWGWLVLNKANGKLQIQTQPNQDPITGDVVPLLGIDVWEHAYYLDYENRRPDYLNEIWKVVNWNNVAERWHAAKE
eukprot:TRINITY_DN5660_c0_g1_i1.p1 TRINITY_DN5660_c0_g1~~TRINITY_DN5660_c0_g1_i1.p1  ORF type:complete len:253 (+),score=129.11 TRINITY_DN5660_c0_g1_i1:55-759(+)